jgi:hypothetical protein
MRILQSIGFRKLILTGIPFWLPVSNVQITFNLAKSFVESAKTSHFVDAIKFCIIFATQMRTLSANMNWWHFTTNVVDS